MKIKPVVVNTAAALIVFGVAVYLLYMAMSNVRSIDVVAVPEVLPPDGKSEAVVEVRLLNVFGGSAWSSRTARFRIVEGHASGEIVATAGHTARVRSTFTAGTIVMRVYVEAVALPYEVRIPVRRLYAHGFSPPARHITGYSTPL